MKSVYVVVDRNTQESLSVPTFERDLARGYLQTIKQQELYKGYKEGLASQRKTKKGESKYE